jgi:hypothetical protein
MLAPMSKLTARPREAGGRLRDRRTGHVHPDPGRRPVVRGRGAARRYNEVTANFRFTSKKLRNGTIKGHLRWQYEFLIPKYPIGTFSIYSCLGEATFSAKPVR